MRIDTRLTDSPVFDTHGLFTIEEHNDRVPSAAFQPHVLEKFAEELSGVEGKVEVSLQNLENDSGEKAKVLVGRVEGTDVASIGMPLLKDGDKRGDD